MKFFHKCTRLPLKLSVCHFIDHELQVYKNRTYLSSPVVITALFGHILTVRLWYTKHRITHKVPI